MAVLQIRWQSLARVAPQKAPAVTTPAEGDGKEGDTPAEAPKPQRAEKPILVYVTDPAAVDGFDKVEKVVMTEDKIVIGTKAFTCVKMSPEQAAADELVNANGKVIPRILIVSADYSDVDVIEGDKISIGKVFGSMNQCFKKHFKGDLEKNAKAMLKVLIEFDKIANERKLIDEKKQRADKPTDADKKEWDKAVKELDERERAANKERDELQKLEPKTVGA